MSNTYCMSCLRSGGRLRGRSTLRRTGRRRIDRRAEEPPRGFGQRGLGRSGCLVGAPRHLVTKRAAQSPGAGLEDRPSPGSIASTKARSFVDRGRSMRIVTCVPSAVSVKVSVLVTFGAPGIGICQRVVKYSGGRQSRISSTIASLP